MPENKRPEVAFRAADVEHVIVGIGAFVVPASDCFDAEGIEGGVVLCKSRGRGSCGDKRQAMRPNAEKTVRALVRCGVAGTPGI
jgi:hypothetical protein